MPLWVLWRKGDAVTGSVREYRWLDAKQFRRRIFYFKKAAIGIERQPLIYVPARMKALDFIDLPITQEHALAVSLLPAIHADPFDRIMIAQAQVEGLAFVTRDARALTYPLKTIRA